MKLRILLLIAWLVGITWHWRTEVPVLPAASLDLPLGTLRLREARDGELIAMHTGAVDLSLQRPADCGPIEFWSLPERRMTRSMLSAADSLEVTSIDGTDWVITRRGDKFRLFDLEQGVTLDDLPASTRILGAAAVDQNRKLVYCDDQTIILRDLVEHRTIWTLEGYRTVYSASWPFAVVGVLPPPGTEVPKNNPWPTVGTQLINLESGRPDSRFGRAGNFFDIEVSGDGRFALLNPFFIVYDVSSGNRIWSADFVRLGLSLEPDIHLSPDGTEVWRRSVEDGRRQIMARWRTADGAVLQAPAARKNTDSQLTARADCRLGITTYPAEDMWGRSENSFLRTFGRWLGRSWLGDYLRTRASAYIVDTHTGRRIAAIPPAHYHLLPGDHGAYVDQGFHFQFYPFPPIRNWAWLFQWATLPPLASWAIFALARRVRRRRSARILENPADFVESSKVGRSQSFPVR